eukprot:61130-Amphidinium_carterae.1
MGEDSKVLMSGESQETSRKNRKQHIQSDPTACGIDYHYASRQFLRKPSHDSCTYSEEEIVHKGICPETEFPI